VILIPATPQHIHLFFDLSPETYRFVDEPVEMLGLFFQTVEIRGGGHVPRGHYRPRPARSLGDDIGWLIPQVSFAKCSPLRLLSNRRQARSRDRRKRKRLQFLRQYR
jgi:hypothetical protein